MRLAASSLSVSEHCAVVPLHESIIQWLDQLVERRLLVLLGPDDAAEGSKISWACGPSRYSDDSATVPGVLHYVFAFRLLLVLAGLDSDADLELMGRNLAARGELRY